jgi:hypothetical protein
MNDEDKFRTFYPDILEKGGLLQVVRALLVARIAGITVNGFGTGQNYAHVQLADKSSQIFLRLNEREFDFDFWRAGQKQASGTTSNLQDMRASVEQWLTGNGDVEELAKAYPFVRPKTGSK